MDIQHYYSLLQRADDAKVHPLASEASMELETRLLEAFVEGAPSSERMEFLEALSKGCAVSVKLAPDAPDTEEVIVKHSLIKAFIELRGSRASNGLRSIPF